MKRTAQVPFWRAKTLDKMSREEWESLCSGCGRCCVLKCEDPDTLKVRYTKWACRYLDLETCRCKCYRSRHKKMPQCVDIFLHFPEVRNWLPMGCSYRAVAEGRDLPSWHPLKTRDPNSVHRAGKSVRGHVIPEPEPYDTTEG